MRLVFAMCVSTGACLDVASIGLLHRLTFEGGLETGDYWHGVACAAELAVRHVNERNGTVVPELARLNRWQLHSVSIDYANFQLGGMASYRKAKELSVPMLVGPATSAVSSVMGLEATIDGIPMLSYWASSPTLADKSLYGTFGRTFPSDSLQAVRLVKALKHYAWTFICIVYIADTYGRNFNRIFTDAAKAAGIQIVTSVSFEGNDEAATRRAVRALHDVGVRTHSRPLRTCGRPCGVRAGCVRGACGCGPRDRRGLRPQFDLFP